MAAGVGSDVKGAWMAGPTCRKLSWLCEGGRGTCLPSEEVGEACHSKDSEVVTFAERPTALLLAADGDASATGWWWWMEKGGSREGKGEEGGREEREDNGGEEEGKRGEGKRGREEERRGEGKSGRRMEERKRGREEREGKAVQVTGTQQTHTHIKNI